jgi:hypothetical protein
VNTATTRRGTLGCRAVVGSGRCRWGVAGGVCWCVSRVGWWGKNYSRSPPHGPPLLAVCRVCASEIVVKRRHPIRPVGEQAVFPGITGPVRVIPGDRGIGGDLLATQLVVNRRLAHEATL